MGTLTYLQYVNFALNRLNEVQLTSSNFATTTSTFQGFAKDAVNHALNDIYVSEREWPFNYQSGTQVLIPGVQLYTLPNSGNVSVDWDSFYIQTPSLITNGSFAGSITGWTNASTGGGSVSYASITRSGNTLGTMLFTPAGGTAAAYQAITAVTGKAYRVQIREFGDSLSVKAGTTVGGSDVYAGTILTYTNYDGGQFFEFTFNGPSSGGTVYIQYSYSGTTSAYLAFCDAFENIQPKKLPFIDYDKWEQQYKQFERRMSATAYTMPERVFPTQNYQFGVSSIPERSYQITFDYWQVPSSMSAYNDTTSIPDKYQQVVIDKLMTYCYMFRDNLEAFGTAKRDYGVGLQQMRTDLINKNDRMRGKQYFSK